MLQDFRDPADGGRDDGAAKRASLQHDDAERLRAGGKAEDRRGVVIRTQVGMRHRTAENHRVRHPEFDGEVMRGYIEARRAVLGAEGIDPDGVAARDAPDARAVLQTFARLVAP